jgi:branched-chain amino acid transport system substrate-binding protein
MTRCRRLLLLLPLAAACARAPDGARAPAGDAPLVLGVGVLPTHPRYAPIVAGARLAVERLNAQPGRRVALRLPPAAIRSEVALAEWLRNDPAVLGVVGGADDAAVVAAMGTYADTAGGGARALPVVSPAAAGSRLRGFNPWFFRVVPSTRDVARFAARWLRDSLPARAAVVVYRNDAAGRDWSATFTEALTASGGRVVSRRPYLPDLTEWEAYARLVAKLAPDVVCFAGAGEDLRRLQDALRAQGVRLPVLGTPDAAPEAPPDAHPAVAPVRAGSDPAWVLVVREGATDEARDFTRRFRARHPGLPELTAALAYDAALTLGTAARRGGTARATLRDALERAGNGAPSVRGALGLVAFRPDHDIRGRTVAVAAVAPTEAP